MVEMSGLLLFGFIVGTYGTLIGIGGGPLHVPFLMICYGFPPIDIVATSLMAILFNVLTGSFYYYRQGKIDIVSGTKFGIAAIPGALLGTLFTKYFTLRFLEVIFGLLLLGLGVYVFTSAIINAANKINRNRGSLSDEEDEDASQVRVKLKRLHEPAKKLVKRVICESNGMKHVYRFNEQTGLIISAIVGFVGPLIGIGGGVFHVPAMTNILKFPTHVATATAHYVLMICVFFALIPYVSMGVIHYGIAIPVGIGSVFGARLGAKLSQQYNSEMLFKLLSVVLMIVSIRLLFFP